MVIEFAESLMLDYVNGKKITTSIQLPASILGVNLSWTSNKNYILNEHGILTKPENDEIVTLNINPILGAVNVKK